MLMNVEAVIAHVFSMAFVIAVIVCVLAAIPSVLAAIVWVLAVMVCVLAVVVLACIYIHAVKCAVKANRVSKTPVSNCILGYFRESPSQGHDDVQIPHIHVDAYCVHYFHILLYYISDILLYFNILKTIAFVPLA